MKKSISILLALILLAGVLSGCGTQKTEKPHKFSVVTTIFPLYDWVMNILGENTEEAEVTLLLDKGVDLHSFQPTADDIIRISACDLFLYVGGESDAWVEDALKEATNKDMTVIPLLTALGTLAKEEELAEGMQAEEEEGEEEGPEYDEHVWLSVKNAALFTDVIRDALIKSDPVHADAYTANAGAYKQKLIELDAQYTAAVEGASRRTVLFGDRFPFRYLTDDYGLTYYAAFLGCSAESEASFETVAFLADKVRELQLPVVLTLEGTDHKIAETVVSASGAPAQILSMDSMQSTTMADIKNGATYLSLMEKNLSVLRQALQ